MQYHAPATDGGGSPFGDLAPPTGTDLELTEKKPWNRTQCGIVDNALLRENCL